MSEMWTLAVPEVGTHGSIARWVGTCQTCGLSSVALKVNVTREGAQHFTCADEFACFLAWRTARP